MEEIPSKKQKNPGLIALNDLFIKMKNDVAVSLHLSDSYLPELEKAFVDGMRHAVEHVILELGDDEVIPFGSQPTQEDIDSYVEEATGYSVEREKVEYPPSDSKADSFEDF